MPAYFESEVVRSLQVLLEEVTRAGPESPKARFVRPDETVIDRLGSRFHHVIYGRRGSGKTSLLRNVQKTQLEQSRLAAWIDYELLMNLSFPDVLVSTLEVMFSDFANQLRASGVTVEPLPKRARKRRKWEARLRSHPLEAILHDLEQIATQLGALKNSPDTADVTWTASKSEAYSIGSATEVGGSLQHSGAGVKAGASKKTEKSSSSDHSITAVYKARKQEHLERVLPLYRALLMRLTREKPDAFVILDELYRLSETDQPQVIGYLHRVIKDTGVWLKIGTLRFGTRLYDSGPPAIGLQVPHDIRELSLDRGLLDFRNSKRFLELILDSLAEEAGANATELLSDGARDRLVLASGGVPRDYIGILSESIAVARSRGPSDKPGSHRVIAEDVNTGAGRTVEAKYADLNEHAGAKAGELRGMVIRLAEHCRVSGSACFLIDVQDASLSAAADILQNMRFAHTIALSESLPDSKSSRFNVFLFDVSQLAAQRAVQVDFMGWVKREKRRSRKLVFRDDAMAPLPLSVDEVRAVVRHAESGVAPNEAPPDDEAIIGEIEPSA